MNYLFQFPYQFHNMPLRFIFGIISLRCKNKDGLWIGFVGITDLWIQGVTKGKLLTHGVCWRKKNNIKFAA